MIFTYTYYNYSIYVVIFSYFCIRKKRPESRDLTQKRQVAALVNGKGFYDALSRMLRAAVAALHRQPMRKKSGCATPIGGVGAEIEI